MLTGLLCKPVCRRAAFSLLFIDNSFQIPAKLTRWPGETTCLPWKVQPDALLMFTQPKIHFTDLHDVTVERAHFFIAQSFTFQHYLALTAVITKPVDLIQHIMESFY